MHDVLYHQFADDITLFTGASYLDPHPSLTKISECITELNLWFSNNHLMLNPNKSEVMFVGSPILLSKSNLPTEVIFDGTTLSVTSKLKILGVTLDSRLNFTHFVSQIIQSSNFHLHAIRQARKFLPSDTAVALIISLVLSRIDYCNSLLCRLPNCLISKLQSLQNRAAKTALQADYYSSSHTCLDRLHWLPVVLRAQFKLLWLTANILYFNARLIYMTVFPLDRLLSLSGLPTLVYAYISLSLLNLSYIAPSRILPLTYGTLFHLMSVFHLLLKFFASV